MEGDGLAQLQIAHGLGGGDWHDRAAARVDDERGGRGEHGARGPELGGQLCAQNTVGTGDECNRACNLRIREASAHRAGEAVCVSCYIWRPWASTCGGMAHEEEKVQAAAAVCRELSAEHSGCAHFESSVRSVHATAAVATARGAQQRAAACGASGACHAPRLSSATSDIYLSNNGPRR